MKRLRDFTATALITGSLLSVVAVTGDGYMVSGIADTIEEMKALVDGITNFIDHVSAFTGFLGGSTIFLLIAVLFFSAGLTAIGIPKGKISFILSLVIADLIWYFWKVSFKPVDYSFTGEMVRANLILIVPVAAVFAAGNLFPRVLPAVTGGVKKLFGRKAFARNELMAQMEHFQGASSRVVTSLARDIVRSRNDSRIMLSPDTKGFLSDVENIISRIRTMEKGGGGRGAAED